MRHAASIILIALGTGALLFGLLSYEPGGRDILGVSSGASFGLEAKATAACGAALLIAGLLLRRRSS